MEKSAHRCAMAKRALERHLQGQGLTKREALRVISRLSNDEIWEQLTLTKRGIILWECRNRD